MQYISKSEIDTAEIAHKIAKTAKKGDVFLLYGTLGMGKSVFARAFIQALCGDDVEVPSPTFTLVQCYEAENLLINHFDLYRLKNDGELFELGVEDAFFDGICLIEWPEKLGRYMPQKYYKVDIAQVGDDRHIIIEFV